MYNGTARLAVAIIALFGLVAVTCIALVGQIWAGGPADLTAGCLGSLTTIAGLVAHQLFFSTPTPPNSGG